MSATTAPADLLVVGAGPAGRALAHRALTAGLRVTVVDPAPQAPWTATFGMFVDDLPAWLDPDVIECAATQFVVYTPYRRTIDRGYCTVDAVALQTALDLSGATVVTASADRLSSSSVILGDGTELRAGCVVDARGGAAPDQSHTVPARQRAVGARIPAAADISAPTPNEAAPNEMVLMDWSRSPATAPSFSYRVSRAGDTRLIEETCLAGRPAVAPDELDRRNRVRLGAAADSAVGPAELVDFPLHPGRSPWHRPAGAALRFGAGGGLMHPATGYSIAESLRAADTVVDALCDGRDPHDALWPWPARLSYRLARIGLECLLALDGPQLTVFFDRFFTLDVPRQRAYLSQRSDAAGLAGTMWAVFRRLPPRLQMRIAATSAVAAIRMTGAELAGLTAAAAGSRRWPSRRRDS